MLELLVACLNVKKIKMTRKTAQAVMDAGIGSFNIIEFAVHDAFVDEWAS